MKTYAFYGFGMAFLGLLVQAILFFAGVYDDVAKFTAVSPYLNAFSILLVVAMTVVGVRDFRHSAGVAEAFTWGKGFKVAILIALFAAVGNVISHLLFSLVINPGASEFLAGVQAQQMRAKGVPEDQIQAALEIGKKFAHPAVTSVFVFLGSLFLGLLVALITPIFTRRAAVAPEAPPPIA